MLFQSQGFILIFLPLAIASYYAAAGSERGRHAVLIAASLVFYGWWDARFIALLVGQIGATWLIAYWHKRSGRAGVLHLGIALNLASLATFKYLDFLLASAESLVGFALPRAHILLPIGISFFSFQLISYLADRLRGDAPVYPLRPFALFVLLFPHLIAGPIVRHNELVPQLALDPRRDGLWRRIAIGLMLFTLGLAKKVLIADKLAELVDPLFTGAAARPLVLVEAWNAALAFSFQLFLDFSAYTEMAIGIALMFGLLLPENFRRPYLATDLSEFWRRWHISLSNFIRDYLYVPLGTSRAGVLRYVPRGRPRALGAILVSMGLCGLWHGAGWTYVAWGLWHGAGLVACHLWQRLGRPLPPVAGWALTMVFVLASFVLFRAADFATAASILASLVGLHGSGGTFGAPVLIVVAALVSTLVPSAHEIKDRAHWPRPAFAAAAAVLAAYCVLEVGKGPPLSFIYFRF
jgi:D-alanyl-lipoteichoic acid acyltransferase DltB (MBOAT superfamily)